MHITKLGHCCLVLDVEGVKILTDPGSFTTEQNFITGINIVLITHEHQDHFHVDSLKLVLANNPHAVVVTNAAVAALIEKENILTTVNIVGDGQSLEVNGVSIEGFGKEHALVYPPDMGLCENTAYMVAQKFYFPGDNFKQPDKAVDVLALPVAGPWMKISEAIDFVKEIRPRVAFGVHDGMISPNSRGFVGRVLEMFVPGTEYVALTDGESREF
ncbi:MAG TPA: MBL fold metallo-hydrolase [Candidatus Paceibacterota bacterium]